MQCTVYPWFSVLFIEMQESIVSILSGIIKGWRSMWTKKKTHQSWSELPANRDTQTPKGHIKTEKFIKQPWQWMTLDLSTAPHPSPPPLTCSFIPEHSINCTAPIRQHQTLLKSMLCRRVQKRIHSCVIHSDLMTLFQHCNLPTDIFRVVSVHTLSATLL